MKSEKAEGGTMEIAMASYSLGLCNGRIMEAQAALARGENVLARDVIMEAGRALEKAMVLLSSEEVK